MRHWSDDHDLAEAIETLGNVVSRAGGDGYDALNVLQDVGSAYLTLAERHRGAVDLLHDVAISGVESELSGYVTVQIDRATWDALAAYRGQ